MSRASFLRLVRLPRSLPLRLVQDLVFLIFQQRIMLVVGEQPVRLLRQQLGQNIVLKGAEMKQARFVQMETLYKVGLNETTRKICRHHSSRM